jgi:hypothetical protein
MKMRCEKIVRDEMGKKKNMKKEEEEEDEEAEQGGGRDVYKKE